MSSFAHGFAPTNQHERMASPRALDVFSTPAPRTQEDVGGGRSASATDENPNDPVATLMRQRDDDARTAWMLDAELKRRATADEELRIARDVAVERVAAMQLELLGEAGPIAGSCVRLASPGATLKSVSHTDGRRPAGATTGRAITPRIVPSSPHPTQRSTSSTRGSHPPDMNSLRAVRGSLRGNCGALSVVRDAHASQLAPYPPSVDSLTAMLPSLTNTGGSRQHGAAEAHHQQAHNNAPPPSRAWSRFQHDGASSAAPPSRGGARSAAPGSGAILSLSPRHPATQLPSTSMLPQSFGASHFQSILKWAEMSYQEALVAKAATSSTTASSADAHHGDGVAQPMPLMTTACCAIVDEVMWHLPGFRPVWEAMRMEIFGAIFKLGVRDVDAGRSGHLDALRSDSATASKGATPCNGVAGPGPTRTASPGALGHLGAPSAADDKAPPASRFGWFSQVCARRPLWCHAAHDAETRVVHLRETIATIKVSLEKYDRIFDIFARSMDRVLVERSFRAWRTTAVRHQRQCDHLVVLVGRKTSAPLITIAFHSWRRIVMQRKLKSSKDKDATLTAVHEARLKTKAAELEKLQVRLGEETRRLQLTAEREARKSAALTTSHAAEVRELASCQEAKDEVILSLEKIAKRWERIAKTFRPTFFRQPIPHALFILAKGVHEAETDLAARGPTMGRLQRCKEELEKLLCAWVNATLDGIGSKAPRLKNCTSDVREGEALAALCKHLIARGGNGRQPQQRQSSGSAVVPPTSSAGAVLRKGSAVVSPTATAAAPHRPSATPSTQPPPHAGSPDVPTTATPLGVQQGTSTTTSDGMGAVADNSLHAVVTQALYRCTSQGMSPLLLSNCPFAARILAKEGFLETPHPTAGHWILASLFVAEMLQSGAQIADASSVRYGCAAEANVAQSTEHALMLADRQHHNSDYVVLRRDSLRAVYQRLEWMREAVVPPCRQDSAADVASMQDGMNDTASDVAAYMGASEGGEDTPLRGPMGSGGVDSDDRHHPSAWDMERVSSTCAPVSSSDDDDGQQHHRIRRLARGSDADGTALAPVSSGDLRNVDRRAAGGTVSPKPFASFSSSPFADRISPTAGQQRVAKPFGDAPFSSGSHFTTDLSTSSGSTRPSLSTTGGTPAVGLPRPSFVEHSTAPTSPSTIDTKEGVAEGTAYLPPVRADLRSLPMHALVRKLRRETKQTESWMGLARLVSSVVLRFRVLDQDAPVKGRSSVTLNADDSATAVANSGGVHEALVSRVGSMTSTRSHSVVHTVPRGGAVAPPSAGVPRSTSGSGPPVSLRRSSGASRTSAHRGSMFFASPSDDPSLGTAPQAAASGQPAPDASGGGSGRRNTLVKFE